MKKRGKILALAAIVVVGAVVLSRCGHKNTAVEYESRPTVRVENPVRQDISLYTDLTGLVEPQSRASVMPKMTFLWNGRPRSFAAMRNKIGRAHV